jgi:hypothetical protein
VKDALDLVGEARDLLVPDRSAGALGEGAYERYGERRRAAEPDRDGKVSLDGDVEIARFGKPEGPTRRGQRSRRLALRRPGR